MGTKTKPKMKKIKDKKVNKKEPKIGKKENDDEVESEIEMDDDDVIHDNDADVVNSSDGNDIDDNDATDKILEEGMSEDDDDVEPSAHGKLLASIQSLDTKKKQKGAIRGIPLAPTNLDLVVHANKDASKVNLTDIKMKKPQNVQELKKPLSSGELELAKRKIARESMVEETSKWDPIVKDIRLAPQIKYTKQEHGIALYETLKPKQFVPRTPLEQELYAALGKSEDIMHPNKELTVAEERALKSMSIKEARARRAELMKHHELLNRMEIKAKRLKRIKSKKYRKIIRREKEVNDKKELEQLQKSDPEAFLERMELLEKARMEERLTLKHKGGGKFSRLHKAYSKFDDKTRTSIQEMLQKSKELTKKREESSSDEDEIDESGKPGIDENSEKNDTPSVKNLQEKLKSISKKAGGWLDGPTKFTYNKKEDSDIQDIKFPNDYNDDVLEKIDDTKSLPVEGNSNDVETMQTESKQNGKGKKRKIMETDDSESCQKTLKPDQNSLSGENVTDAPSTEEPNSQKKKKKKKDNNLDGKLEDSGKPSTLTAHLDIDDKEMENEEKEEEQSSTKKKKKRKKKNKKVDEKAEEPVKPATLTTLKDVDEKNREIEKDDEEGDGHLKVSMEELFEDEDFVEEFAREKEQLEEQSRPKVEDLKLPGWGSWAGPDYKEAQKAQAQKKKKVAMKAMKKVKKPTVSPYVWLNPNRDEHMQKLQPKKAPFPFTSVQQYEASLRQPVSRGLVCETASKLLTKPAVVTKQGYIIKPIDKEDYFEKSSGIHVDDNDKNFGGDVKANSSKKSNKRKSVR